MTGNTMMPTLDDVLHEFSLSADRPTRELLDEFVRLYPDYTRELTEFAAEWAFETRVIGEAEQPPAHDNLVSIATSRFLNRLHQLKKERSEAPSQNAIASLSKQDFRALVARMDLSIPFLTKLRDGMIYADTLPPAFCDELGRGLNMPPAAVIASLPRQAEIRSGARFKADGKPTAEEPETFEEAVRSSGLTREQQARLIAMIRG